VSEHRGRSGLQELETDWRRLYSTMPQRSLHHSFGAYSAYLNWLCSNPDEVRHLALHDEREVRAICPLEPRFIRAFGKTIPAWGLPWHSHWQITDVIAPEDDARAALLPATVPYLRRRHEGRRTLLAGPLPQASRLWEGLEGLGATKYLATSSRPSYVVDCSRTYNELFSALSKNLRQNLRKSRNRLSTFGGVRFVAAHNGEDLERELDSFLSVEASGWKGEQGAQSAILLNPRLAGFYRDLVTSLRGSGDRCEIHSLYVENRCASSIIRVRTGDEFALLKIAYDETFAQLGPGQLLIDRMLRDCCEDTEISSINFLSDAPWLRVWGVNELPMQQAQVAVGRLAGRPTVSYLGLRHSVARRLPQRLRK